jgi:hypothetical protein
MLISIDPSSKKTGIALFSLDGELIDTWQLCTEELTWGNRLADQALQFKKLPFRHAEITEVASELLKGAANSVTLNAVLGVFIQHLPNAAFSPKSFIPPSSWKAFIRKKTKENVVKGVASLKKFGYVVKGLSEDEADSVMIGLCYLNKTRG